MLLTTTWDWLKERLEGAQLLADGEEADMQISGTRHCSVSNTQFVTLFSIPAMRSARLSTQSLPKTVRATTAKATLSSRV